MALPDISMLRAVYARPFKASAETVTTIAADPKRMGAKVGLTSVLHTRALTILQHDDPVGERHRLSQPPIRRGALRVCSNPPALISQPPIRRGALWPGP